MEPHYSKEKEGAGNGGRWGGEPTPECAAPRPFPARPRRNGRIPGWTWRHAGTRDGGCTEPLGAAEQANGHRARSLRPSYLRTPVCSWAPSCNKKFIFVQPANAERLRVIDSV